MISSGGSAGSHLHQLMNSIGFSNQLGNVAGASLDATIGSNIHVAQTLFDAFLPLSSGTLDRLMSEGFCSEGSFPRPHVNYSHHFANHRTTHYEREHVSAYKMDPLGQQKGVMIDGKKVDVGLQAKGMTPTEFESKLMEDPKLRATVEAQIGGRIVYDGKADGQISVARYLYHPCIPFNGMIHQNVTGMLNRCANPMIQQNMLQGLATALRNALPDFDSAGILNNPNLTFDQKLAQLLQGFIKKFEQELMKKLEGLLEGGGVQAPRRKKKKKGIGGKLKKGLKGIKKGVSKFGKMAKGLGKGLMKGVFKSLTGGLLKGLLGGNLGMLFQLGTGLLGGIVGGPIGSSLIAQLAKGKIKPKTLLKAANPINQFKAMMDPKQVVAVQLHQVFAQMNGMFQVMNGVSKGISDVQRQSMSHLLRG
jgi:hypothetical protein